MRLDWKRNGSLWVAIAALWGTLAMLVHQTLALTGGELAYAIDDTYIHMAMARNLAEHGLWGITPYGFTSSASSIAWPALIGMADRLVGVQLWLPLAFNLVLATALLMACHCALMRRPVGAHPLVTLGALLAIVYVMPLHINVLIGMEHVLQTLVTLSAAYVAARLATDDAAWADKRWRWGLVALSAVLPAVRYEGLFVVAAIGALMLWRRRVAFAAVLGVAAVVPVGAFGLFSLHQGWFVLPNPVLLKGTTPSLSFAGLRAQLARGTGQLLYTSHVLAFVLAAGACLVGRLRGAGLKTFSQAYSALFVAVAAMHMSFASTGWYFRYEAYLVAWGILATAIALQEILHAEPAQRGRLARAVGAGALAVLALAVASPSAGARLRSLAAMPGAIADRALVAIRIPPGSSAERYFQQVQMGRFVNAYYAGGVVAANDIGAINFYAPVHCMDLVGLADMDVARLYRQHAFSPEALGRLARARGVQIAIVYEHWFKGRLPAGWVRVGCWRQRGVQGGRGRVAFYAVDPAERSRLTAHLSAFKLPSEVVLELDAPSRAH